jgi:hypothetical protein
MPSRALPENTVKTLKSWLGRFTTDYSLPASARVRLKSAQTRFQPLLEQLERRELPALVIHPTFESSITHDPNAAKIEGTINAAIRAMESSISNSVTVNISFGEMGSGLGQSSWFFITVPYTSYLAAQRSRVG